MEAVTELHVVIDLKREGIVRFTKPLTRHDLVFGSFAEVQNISV